YALARTIVPRRFALFAATASCAIPALLYASTLMEEVLAYPFATLAFWLILRALVERTGGWIAGAAAACLAAPFVRRELALLPVVLVTAGGLVLGWERWPQWSSARRAAAMAAGAGTALIGLALLLGGSGGARAALHHPHRFADSIAWSAGALTIGLGMLPVIAGFAALARPRQEPPRREVRAFGAVLVCATVVFLVYAGGKAASAPAFNSILERNLIYLAPLVFAGTALALARGYVRALPALLAAVLALGAALTLPVRLQPWPNADAPTLSVLTAVRSRFGWDMTQLRVGLVVAAALALGALFLLTALRDRPRERAALVGVIGVA